MMVIFSGCSPACLKKRFWVINKSTHQFGHIILMLKYLQVESQGYFRNRTFAEAFSALGQRGDRTSFYTMLVAATLASGVEQAVNYLAEASVAHHLDASALLSALWGVSLQTTPNTDEAKKLFSLISLIHARNIIDKSTLLADLPEWAAQGAGLMEIAAFERRTARVYTKINYEQSKYSLLRENNEGYAKLTLLLINMRDTHNIDSIWHRMMDLVGNFDLDPDRVLDLVIEARVHNPATRNYLRLLRNFRRESITAVLGNKLRMIKGKPIDAALFEKAVYVGPMETFDAGSGEELQQAVSPHLVSLCAELIKQEILTYQDMLPYLQPGDYAIRHLNSKKVELSLQKIKECFTLNTEELDDIEKIKLLNEENLKFQGQLLHSTKLALISEMVRLNDWVAFEAAWAPFKEKIDLLLYQPLLKNLLNLLEWAIEPLSQPVGFQRFFRFQMKGLVFAFEGSEKQHGRITTLEGEDLKRLDNLLSYIGKFIGFRPRLFIKLCRIFKRQAKQGGGQIMKPFIQKYLIMGSCVAENNAAMSIQLYELLDCYEYIFRYQCYMLIYQGGMTDCPYVARIFESIKRKQNIIVNNLSKENKKLFIRKISKLTHNQALPIFYWIIRRIIMEDYEAVVPEIVAVLSNASPLTLDMTIFVMLFTLNENKEPPVNLKTHQCYAWFKNVTTFISTFFRKYLETDIQPVFDYIIMKTGKLPELEDDQLPGDLLKLLHEILNKMHGSVMISEVNKTKYDAIAAGPRLQAEILELTSEVRAAKKSKIFLQKFFWERNAVHQSGFSLAFNLLVLLAQKRAELFTKTFIDDIKIVGDIFDEYSMLIVQIVRVLLYQAQDYSHYAQLLPADAIKIMIRDYKLPLEVVCEVVRPGIKHIAMMTPQEWTQLTTDFSSVYSECLKDEKYLVKSSRVNEKWAALLSAYKDKVLEYIPINFFTAFWFLTLDSVYFPAKSYAEKIDDLKKKIEPNRKGDRGGQRNQRELQRMRTLYDKLLKEEEAQRKKYNDTLSEENLKKLDVDILHGATDKGRESIFIFAEQFVQSCLLPRMMLDRTQALYCVKFTIEMIKSNKMAVTKSIRLLTYIIEYVMGYLPFTTHREASNCISVFLAEILAIFNNWNDSVKLKQDLKRILGVEDAAGKDNYPKLKDYLIKLYERVGNTLRGVKEEPYLIKNCLYILEKVDSIPSYKEQADELAQHMNELKELYPTVDMRTSLDRQIAILTAKKAELPDRPERIEDKKANPKPDEPAKQISQKEITSTVKISTPIPVPPPAAQSIPKSPIVSHPPPSNNGQSNNNKRQADNRPPENRSRFESRPEEKSSQRAANVANANANANANATNEQKQKSRFTFEKPVDKREDRNEEKKKEEFPKRQEIRNPFVAATYQPQGRFTEEKVEPKTIGLIGPPKTVKEMREEMLRQSALNATQNVQTAPVATSVPAATSQPTPPPAASNATNTALQPSPVETSQNNAAKPSQQESKLTAGPPLRSQKPASSATIELINPQPNLNTKETHPTELKEKKEEELTQRKQITQVVKMESRAKNQPSLERADKQANKEKVERKDQKLSPTLQRRKEDRWRDNKNSNNNNNYKRDNNKDPKQFNRDRDTSHNNHRDNRQAKPKGPAFVYSRQRNKSEDRRQQPRKQERREKSKEREKDRSKQREKDKDRERDNKDKERRYDKYHRSRSRDKYGRR